ncbi:MAG: hypothetical protein HFE57_08625 [Firmicutes bacterium]|jgi:hypothetical protein|nr:hypothetical protein [Bacillota bacterium]
MNDSLNGTGNESSDVNVDVNSEEDKITSSDTMESDTINFIFDGVPVKIKDSKGDDAEAFISGGTVYIPATAVGEAVGKAVTYDGTSKTLYIGTNPNIKNYLFNVCPPTDGSYTEYTGGKTFEMRGKKYKEVEVKKINIILSKNYIDFFSGLVIINTWQQFGNKKSVSQNKIWN